MWGQGDQLVLVWIDVSLGHIFVYFFGGLIKHADEQIVSVVVGMSLLEVIANDASIGRFDSSAGVFRRYILHFYFRKFCEFHLK